MLTSSIMAPAQSVTASKRSWLTLIFYVVNIGAAFISFTGLTYNLQTVFLLIDGGEFFVPLVYILMCVFWVFNICFLLKGVSDNDTMKWTVTVEFFEVVSWFTVLVFVALNAGLFYFGEYVETSHEAFILLLFWVNGFVGPFVMLSFGFLGLLHFMNSDLESSL